MTQSNPLLYVVSVSPSHNCQSPSLYDHTFTNYRPLCDKCTEYPPNDHEHYKIERYTIYALLVYLSNKFHSFSSRNRFCDVVEIGDVPNGLRLTIKGGVYTPNMARSPDFFDPNHQSPKRNSLITNILTYYESVDIHTALRSLRERFTCQIYQIYRQSPITHFLQGPITVHGKCMFSPS